MGKAEDLVKEFLIKQNKLANELLIKYFGDESFKPASKQTEQRKITTEPEQPTMKSLTRADVINTFPQELRSQLLFTEADSNINVKPKQYLGSDTFRRAAAIATTQLGGEYVSQGRDSYFRIPKRQP